MKYRKKKANISLSSTASSFWREVSQSQNSEKIKRSNLSSKKSIQINPTSAQCLNQQIGELNLQDGSDKGKKNVIVEEISKNEFERSRLKEEEKDVKDNDMRITSFEKNPQIINFAQYDKGKCITSYSLNRDFPDLIESQRQLKTYLLD
jgi:hypothetical protein